MSQLVIPAGGSGRLLRVEYPPSTDADGLQVGVTYTLWVPDGVARLRGVIVHQHGAGTTAAREGATAAYDLHWQALARKWDCALLARPTSWPRRTSTWVARRSTLARPRS